VGVNYCEGEHTPGAPFESGNVYCKKCGKFLYIGQRSDEGPEAYKLRCWAEANGIPVSVKE
jgi:hypothetical protein